MTSHLNLPAARFFTDFRPQCEIENEMKRYFRAKTNQDYGSLLQVNADKIINANREQLVRNVKSYVQENKAV